MTVKRYFLFILGFVVLLGFFISITLNINLEREEIDEEMWQQIISLPVSYEVGSIELTQNNIYYIISNDEKITSNFVRTFNYAKKFYHLANSFDNLKADVQYGAIIIATDVINENDTVLLEAVLQNNTPVIFAKMPDIKSLSNKRLRELMGIVNLGEQYEQNGIQVIEGMLFGGMHAFEDLTVNALAVSLNSKCKVYIKAYEEEVVPEDRKNPLMWRLYHEGTQVQVFNNELISMGADGLILSALANTKDSYVYPIISSISVSFMNFPLGDDFADASRKKYERDTQTMVRDYIFPDLILLATHTGMPLSFFALESDNDPEYWRNEMEKKGFLFNRHPPGNAFYYMQTSTGYYQSPEAFILSRSDVTARGLTKHTADLAQVFADGDYYEWREMYKALSSYITDINNLYPWLSKNVLDEASHAAYNYNLLMPTINYSEGEININCASFYDGAAFIVRVKGEQEVTSDEYTEIYKIESGVFKVTLHSAETILKIAGAN